MTPEQTIRTALARLAMPDREAMAALGQLLAERDELRAALRDEMQWDMGGIPENEWMRQAREAKDALADIASGDWQRYPQRERHRCTTVQQFALWTLEHVSNASGTDASSSGVSS